MLAGTSLAPLWLSIVPDTHQNVTYHVGPSAVLDRLTLTTAIETVAFTITKGATITVYDASGVKLNPQPQLTVSPTTGVEGTTATINLPDGQNFPAGGTVVISELTTPGQIAAPSGAFSNQH